MNSGNSSNNGHGTSAATDSADKTADKTADKLERAARALLDARMASVRALAGSRHQVSELRGQLADAEREDVRLYSAALRDGWSADELKKLGLDEPEKKTRTRRTKTTSTGPSGTSSATSNAGRARGTENSAGGGAGADDSESLQTV